MCRKTKRKIIFIVVAIVILNVCFILALKSVSPKIVEYANAQVKTISTMSVNNAVLKTLQNFGYEDFVTIEKDNEGKIACLQANSMLMNNLARIVVVAVQEELSKTARSGVSMPLGNLSGLAIFTGIGPDLNFKLKSYENVTCEFVSEFTAAGINQTRHRIILKVYSSVNLIVPTANTELKNTTDVIVAESVLVGVVPNIYLDFG